LPRSPTGSSPIGCSYPSVSWLPRFTVDTTGVELPPLNGVERLTDLGSGAILAVATETGRGKVSGVSVDRHFATLYTVIDRKIAPVTQFRTEQDALEAAGLSE
jgi:hypothetical protein